MGNQNAFQGYQKDAEYLRLKAKCIAFHLSNTCWLRLEVTSNELQNLEKIYFDLSCTSYCRVGY